MAPKSRRLFLELVGICTLMSAAMDAFALSLANEPLFVTTPVKPNVILGIDDSGSMDSEVLVPTNDGALWWNSEQQSFVGLDRSDALSPGTLNYNGEGDSNSFWRKYVYLFPMGTGTGRRVYSDQSGHYAVPPTPEYAFARCAAYNRAYYDPSKTYLPWPSSFGRDFTDSVPTAASSDPVRGTVTVDLTSNIFTTSSNWTFKLQPGMRNSSGQQVAESAEDGSFTYFPASYYSIDTEGRCSSPVPSDYMSFVTNPGQRPAGVDAIGPDGQCLIEYQIKPGNAFPSARTYEEELQNFANWFTYHRKRHQAMRSGILNAFAGISGIRAGLFGFNDRPSTLAILDIDTERFEFFDTLKGLVGSGGTPTREALNFIGEQLMRTGGSAPITRHCQKNFAILFTDGFAVPTSISGIGNEDGAAGAPYEDDYSSTLGDIAMRYYANNLRQDLVAHGVPTSNGCRSGSPNPLLDCNEQLHMVTYGVGLGVQGTIYGDTHSSRADAHATPPLWSEPNVNRNPVQIDDLYHATVNGRGELLNAATPDAIADNMNQVLSSILDAISSASSVAANSTSVSTGSRVFQSRFHSSTWRGQLLAFDIDYDGTIPVIPVWDAGAALNGRASATRTIFTLSRDSGDGIPFRWPELSAQTDTLQADLLNSDAYGTVDVRGDERVDFLRGDHVVGFKARNYKLGDIVQSSPLHVGRPQGGYGGAAYASFASGMSARREMIYVGANDGMVHGFDAQTGAERIAYVPSAVYPNLSRLTDPDYGQTLLPHRYFVDGSPMSADVYVNGSWMTVLAGGLNAGGQAYYALDITDPAGFFETSAAALDTVLWEFTDQDDADLGYTYNQPLINYGVMQSAQIAKMNDGSWSLIVGNGYNNTEADGHASTTGHAALFVLDIGAGMDGGWDSADYTKIDTGVGSTARPNGLATPTPIDIDGDGDIDIAYAGDLEGNIWKFDLTDPTASSWSVERLYSAVDSSGNPQPVTTALMVLPHPNGGHMVSFGTGQYLEVADLSTTDEQSLYGIWDAALNGSASTITGGRANLVEQSVLATIRVSNTDLRITSDHAVDYGSKRGWYMDLPTSGERVGYNPIVRDRRFVFVTLIPDVDPCAAGGSGWIMELDYLSGSRLAQSPFDVNGDLAISGLDLVDYTEDGDTTSVPASGIALDIGIPATPTVIGRDERTEFKVISGSSGDMATLLEGKSIAGGRLSWKQIIDDSE